MEKIVRYNQQFNRYKKSKFYFITGKGDMTESSLLFGYNTLHSLNIDCTFHVYNELLHQYPPDLKKHVRLLFEKI